jgi:RHS repeat-associated protein
VITDSAGVIKAESDYYPWGGELQFVNNDSNDYKFTGKKRDAETGLDYFGARYYSNGLGRWVSADWSAAPEPVPYADFYDPQTLNLYQFVGGNPASKADPDGHDGATATVELVADKTVSEMLKGVAQRMLLKAVAGAVAGAAGAVEIGLKVKECIEIQTDINNTLADAEWQENVAANKLTQAQAQAQQQQAQETEHTPEPAPASGGAQKGNGRGGKQERLNELGKDPKTSSADRGWIKQDQNAIKDGKRDTVRVPPGKNMAHARGREASKGYSHTTSPSSLQNIQNHRTQHKYDANGTKNKERP